MQAEIRSPASVALRRFLPRRRCTGGAILSTLARFCHLDIVVASAAILRPVERCTLTPCAVLFQVTVELCHHLLALASGGLNEWWDVLGVTMRGAYNLI